jgi:hypothetical protein
MHRKFFVLLEKKDYKSVKSDIAHSYYLHSGIVISAS